MAHITQYLSKHSNNDTLYDELSQHFKIIDNNHIFMLRYLKGKSSNDFIRKTRGIIIDKETQRIICYPLEGKISLQEFKNKNDYSNVVVEESIDGTLINMYHYNHMWYFSTRSTLNGECFWNSNQSFKELFINTLSQYNLQMKQLNTSFTYSFILCHPETRNVTLYKKPRLYHVLTRDLNSFNEININLGIPKPKILKLDDINIIDCHNYDDLIQYCSRLHFNQEGIMLYSKDRQYRTKIKGKNHIKVKHIRGNHSNIKYAILDSLRSSPTKNIQTLLKYYPEYTNTYTRIVSKIDILQSEILYIYTNIKKLKQKQFQYHLKYKKAIRELHNQYIYLIKNYKPSIHNYKPCINACKVKHYLYKEVDLSYIVYLLSTI